MNTVCDLYPMDKSIEKIKRYLQSFEAWGLKSKNRILL